MNVKSINDLNKNFLTVVCTTNEKYMQYLYPFLASINKNCKQINVIIRLVNVTSKLSMYDNFNTFYINEVKKFDNGIIINQEDSKNLNFLELKDIVKNNILGNSIFKKKEAVYCSNIKFNTINTLLYNGFKHICYLDVDTIVRKDFNNLIDITKKYDIAMFIDDNDINSYTTKYGDSYMGLNAGFMYVNNTNASKVFYNILEKKVNADIFDIEADEVEFQKLYKNSNIKMFNVSSKYKDNGPVYNFDSYMWSGQSDEKVYNTIFKDELRKYYIS